MIALQMSPKIGVHMAWVVRVCMEFCNFFKAAI